MTTLGMGQEEMRIIADIIVAVLSHTKPSMAKSGQPRKAACAVEPAMLAKCQLRVKELLSGFPLYPEIPLEESTQLPLFKIKNESFLVSVSIQTIPRTAKLFIFWHIPGPSEMG